MIRFVEKDAQSAREDAAGKSKVSRASASFHRNTRTCVDLSPARCQRGTVPAAAQKKSRIVTRIPSGVRKTIQAAADLEGASLNHFLVQAAYRQAQEIIERETILRLNREETRRVFDLLDHPPKPNAALLAAKAAHRRLVGA